MEEIYLAGGCLWGVQEYVKHLPGVVHTEAGRANGHSQHTNAAYDGYAECVKTTFDPKVLSVSDLASYFFEIINPHSIDQQGDDIGKKYRTGIYSKNESHLSEVKNFIAQLNSPKPIVVEVLKLTNYVRSDDEHQDRLTRFPNDYCHISKHQLYKYKNQK